MSSSAMLAPSQERKPHSAPAAKRAPVRRQTNRAPDIRAAGNLSVQRLSLQKCGGHKCPPSGCSPARKRRIEGHSHEDPLGDIPTAVFGVLTRSGHPMDGRTRAAMESVFGHDLRGLRIHSDSAAAATLPGDEFLPGAEPVEEDVIPTSGESMTSQNASPAALGECHACESGHGICPKCASAAVPKDLVHRRPSGHRSIRYATAGLRRSIGNRPVLRLTTSPFIQVIRAVRSPAPVQDPMRMPVASVPCRSAPAALETPAQNHTYTFTSRGSYGQTSPGFTRPSCVAGAGGAATLVAGSASPTITVFPTGTYRVRRDDGVEQTATCTRLAAGLAATRAHEESHAAGARAGVASANSAQGLPRNFPTAAACAAALPGMLAAWNTTVNAAWANEVAHGPGTNPPTPQTFTQEHAAGTCTFA
jgi:hypothetical protein